MFSIGRIEAKFAAKRTVCEMKTHSNPIVVRLKFSMDSVGEGLPAEKKDEIIFILRVSGGIFKIFPDCIIFSAGNSIIW